MCVLWLVQVFSLCCWMSTQLPVQQSSSEFYSAGTPWSSRKLDQHWQANKLLRYKQWQPLMRPLHLFVVYWWDFKRIIHILALQSFSAQIGKMRGRFGPFDSPISIALVTSRGGRESCGDALRTLRSLGVNADEAYCLAGVPRGPIKRLLRPHFLLSECFSSNWEDQTDDDLGFQKKQNKLHCVLK